MIKLAVNVVGGTSWLVYGFINREKTICVVSYAARKYIVGDREGNLVPYPLMRFVFRFGISISSTFFVLI
jgi:hypothetical protein